MSRVIDALACPSIRCTAFTLAHGGTTFFDCRRAHLRAKTDTGLTVISIGGELDASNVDDVSYRVRDLASDCGALIADLADVDFIALDGLQALFALNIQCARAGTTLALIASHAVNRLLRVGDHDKLLPAVGSATEALLLIRRSSRGHRSSARPSRLPPTPAAIGATAPDHQ